MLAFNKTDFRNKNGNNIYLQNQPTIANKITPIYKLLNNKSDTILTYPVFMRQLADLKEIFAGKNTLYYAFIQQLVYYIFHNMKQKDGITPDALVLHLMQHSPSLFRPQSNQDQAAVIWQCPQTGFTCLISAANSAEHTVLAKLVKLAHKDLNKEEFLGFLTAKNRQGHSALHTIIHYSYTEGVKTLLKSAQRYLTPQNFYMFLTQENAYGNSALIIAALQEYNAREMVGELLEKAKSYLTINELYNFLIQKNEHGDSALLAAAKKGRASVVSRLLQAFKFVEENSNQVHREDIAFHRNAALSFAALSAAKNKEYNRTIDYELVLTALLNHGANPYAKNEKGFSASENYPTFYCWRKKQSGKRRYGSFYGNQNHCNADDKRYQSRQRSCTH